MDIVAQVKASKILQRQAFEAGKTCEVGDRRKSIDQLVAIGISMGFTKSMANEIVVDSFIAGCEVGSWCTWGL